MQCREDEQKLKKGFGVPVLYSIYIYVHYHTSDQALCCSAKPQEIELHFLKTFFLNSLTGVHYGRCYIQTRNF